jgi:hypothetical protein
MYGIGMDILIHSLYETLMLFPYLYLTYLLMEFLENKMSRRYMIYVRKAGEYGPVVGGGLGIIPQCGFSVVSSNLYATGLITLGTMMAVFLSTSDEMLPILISGGVSVALIIQILSIKFIFAVLSGVCIDKFLPQSFIKHKNEPDISSFCKREKCKCDHKKNIFKSAFMHTEKICIFIFIFSLIVNAIFMLGGNGTIKSTLIDLPVISKFVSSAIGLIPSCYPSVMLTQLYINGAISIGTLMAGTLSNAGLGYLVLYKVNANKQENLRILALLYIIGVGCGIISDILF